MATKREFNEAVAVPYYGHKLHLSKPELSKVLGIYEMSRNLDVDVPTLCEWIAKHSTELQELTDLKEKLREINSHIMDISHTLQNSPLTKY